MKEKYLIEGSFLMEKPTGIQRLVLETLYAMDKLVEKEKIALIIPAGYIGRAPSLKNIRIIECGNGSSKRKWVYSTPRQYAKKNKMVLVNLGSAFPANRDSSVMIADTRLREGLFNETLRWRITSSVKGYLSTHTAKNIVTISQFIKERIIHFYHIPADKITVAYCAWQHYERIVPDEKVFDKFPSIRQGEYFYTVGSIAPHKNYKWIIGAAKHNPKCSFVVSGAMRKDVWDDQGIDVAADNIIYTDYVSDEEMKALMMHAKAFLFPTLYEGFGIPPMEAMSVGVDCIVSDIPVMHEVYGDSVHYIDPNNANVNLSEVLGQQLKIPREDILKKYSWDNAAKEWMRVLGIS